MEAKNATKMFQVQLETSPKLAILTNEFLGIMTKLITEAMHDPQLPPTGYAAAIMDIMLAASKMVVENKEMSDAITFSGTQGNGTVH